jgi:ABC-type multidrug transport system ATPase subunit
MQDGDRLLEQLGLADNRNAWFMTLSGGQKQQLFIVLALINDPQIVFLDELTTSVCMVRQDFQKYTFQLCVMQTHEMR